MNIYLMEHDPTWGSQFEAEKKAIDACMGDWIHGGIHHVGSTAVPGLMAKPVIDIMVGVKNLETARPCITLLESLSYCYFPYKPEFMHWFCKPSPEQRTHHLYLMDPTHPEWQARLAFRDRLGQHTKSLSWSLLTPILMIGRPIQLINQNL